MLSIETFCPLTDELLPVHRLSPEASLAAVAECVASWLGPHASRHDFAGLMDRTHLEYLDLPTGESYVRVTCPAAVSDWRRVG